jgi:hypothetical protein
MLCFWMTVQETGEPVRIFVTYNALWRLDPSQLRDVPAAIEIFNKKRASLEAAASNKFDTVGAESDPRGAASRDDIRR